MSKGRQSLAVYRCTRQGDGCRRQRHADTFPEQRVRSQEVDRLRNESDTERAQKAHRCSALVVRRIGGVRRRRHRVDVEAGLSDGLFDARPGCLRSIDGEHAGGQIEAQCPDPGEGVERAPDLRFLGQTIHLRDAQQQPVTGAQRRRCHRRHRARMPGATRLMCIACRRRDGRRRNGFAWDASVTVHDSAKRSATQKTPVEQASGTIESPVAATESSPEERSRD